MMHGRPLGQRRTIGALVILTLLAWATQTLLSQLGFGAEERFVASGLCGGATMELRGEATITGTDVTVQQIFRWSQAQADAVRPIADLVLARLGDRTPFVRITLIDVKRVLSEAGANLAMLQFAGATACTVSRSDAQFNEQAAMERWLGTKIGAGSAPAAAGAVPSSISDGAKGASAQQAAAVMASPVLSADSSDAVESPYKNLRQVLVGEMAIRLGRAVESLQLHFDPAEERLLALSEPHFRFQADPCGGRGLGDVAWDVMVIPSGPTSGAARKVRIAATARAWESQLVIARPVSHRQILRAEDVVARRALVDQLEDDPLLTIEQVVGEQAARDLKPGMVLTARMVDAAPLARSGQLVTVLLSSGAVQIKTVGRAVEGGSYGQSIKVKNEASGDVYEVTLVGPQTGRLSGR